MSEENKKLDDVLADPELKKLLDLPDGNSPAAESEKIPEAAPAEPAAAEAGNTPDNSENAPEASEKNFGTNSHKTRALVMYMIGLFGIAFLIVLGSLMANHPSSDEAKRIQSLQAQLDGVNAECNNLRDEKNELLVDNEELQIQIDKLSQDLLEMAGSAEYIEGEAAMSDREAQLMQKKLEVYGLIMKAQTAVIQFDQKSLDKALAELEENIDYMDENALNTYYTIMEFVEQPSWAEKRR